MPNLLIVTCASCNGDELGLLHNQESVILDFIMTPCTTMVVTTQQNNLLACACWQLEKATNIVTMTTAA